VARRSAIAPDPGPHRSGSGEPLVLIHGGGGTWRLWKPAIPLLERRHDVLAVALAGHYGGPEIPPDAEAGLDVLVEGVERDMDAAGFETAHIAGGSAGGWVALELARRGRARSVVAIAPAGGWELGDLSFHVVAWIYRTLMLGTRLIAPHARFWAARPGFRKLLAWHHFAHPERISPDDFAYQIVAFANTMRLMDGFAWAREHGGVQDLDRIACPVLLAFPEKDRILPRRRYGELIIGAVPGAEVVDLRGAGHAPMADDPELVAETILDFTARHAGAGAVSRVAAGAR
jgi:pimeloyl-ACP methyl ester carboxylesterase